MISRRVLIISAKSINYYVFMLQLHIHIYVQVIINCQMSYFQIGITLYWKKFELDSLEKSQSGISCQFGTAWRPDYGMPRFFGGGIGGGISSIFMAAPPSAFAPDLLILGFGFGLVDGTAWTCFHFNQFIFHMYLITYFCTKQCIIPNNICKNKTKTHGEERAN